MLVSARFLTPLVKARGFGMTQLEGTQLGGIHNFPDCLVRLPVYRIHILGAGIAE